MTTNFALSLSFDGIRLLQRVEGGWHLVGETALDVPDLASELAKLNADALALDPSGLRTKLLIPNEQIKFLKLETAQTGLDDVRGALEGATPYAVDDLVIDFDRNGGRTYIAAVARETLEEAEGFAKEYNFNPVSFAAIAEPMTFGSEVFFGPSSVASKYTSAPITRDPEPIAVTGKAVVPQPEPEESDEPPLFTPRPRMAAPESVAASSPQPTIGKAVVKADPATVRQDDPADVNFTRRPAPLAVPTGDTGGPAIAVHTKDTPPAPAKPVSTKVSEPTIAPVVQRAPSAPAAAPTISTPQPEDMAAKGGFSSRRAGAKEPAAPEPEQASSKTAKPAAIASKQAQTKRGKPRFLGLILTAILLLVMALVAIWASTLSEEDLAGWFGYDAGGVLETAAVLPPVTEDATATDLAAVAPEAPDVPEAAAAPAQDTTTAPLPQVRTSGRVLSPAEADRIYAATGVWQRAPRLPLEPRSETFSAAIPSITLASAPIARPTLPVEGPMSPDLTLLAPVNPPAPDATFARDADGFILATPEGTLTPEGAIVIAGAPSKRPPLRPAAAAPEAVPAENLLAAPEGVIVIAGRPSKVPPLRPRDAALPEEAAAADPVTAGGVALAGLRPSVRPEGLAPEQTETVVAAADPALAGNRPKQRPAGLAPAAPVEPETPDITDVVAAIARAAPVSPYVSPTARAVQISRRPDTRPRNFSRVVARATDLANQQAARAATAATAPTTSVAATAARPTGNTPGGVARAATLQSAIRLRDINLIGVYGRPNDRRALVRLGNGRYVKVEVGSTLDGGRVTAIGDNALNYTKRGKTYALQLPTG